MLSCGIGVFRSGRKKREKARKKGTQSHNARYRTR